VTDSDYHDDIRTTAGDGRTRSPASVPVTEQRPAGEPVRGTADTTQSFEGTRTLDLAEERVQVTREPVEVGTVRISRRVITHTETVTVPLREERLVIECLPGATVGIQVDGRELQPGEPVEITLYKERAIVDKEAVITQQATVRKVTVEREEPIQAELRREDLVVDADEGLVVDSADNWMGEQETEIHPRVPSGASRQPHA
jgi:uncharacterized protein (TIGR02271 family)